MQQIATNLAVGVSLLFLNRKKQRTLDSEILAA
jgi:hypothetical protein